MEEKNLSQSFGLVASAIMQDDSISIPARALYALLASYADHDTRVCYPLNETLCTKMGCSSSKLQRLLAELKTHDIMKRIDRSAEGHSSVTQLLDLFAPHASRMGRGGTHVLGTGTTQDGVEALPAGGYHNKTSVNKTTRTERRASAAPAEWIVTAPQTGTKTLSLAEWAEQEFSIKNIEWLQRQVNMCLDYCRANGKTYKDWQAMIRKWVTKEVERALPARRSAPTLESSEPTEDEIRQWLRDHLMRVDNPVWTRLREAQLDGTDEVPRLEEEWRLERRRIAIEALQAER